MSSRFFNNENGNTLFEKLKAVAENMAHFDRFLAVAGYFRSSGYFRLRRELEGVGEIKVLAGINVDDLYRGHNKGNLFLPKPEDIKEGYFKEYVEDIKAAGYSAEIEEGIRQFIEDIGSGRLELRIHGSRDLHAKFYLCLPRVHNEHTDGSVIMGSSNISDAGLGISEDRRYELNVLLKDFDDVKYCVDQFEKLWKEGVEVEWEDVVRYNKRTYLGFEPSPYELYMKVLIDVFGDQVEDGYVMDIPEGVRDLKYQRDAVVQGFGMLMRHNGLILADVVGLGKTLVATMIAKRFVETSGPGCRVLVVYPPALERVWKDEFRRFGIESRAQFVSNGSLNKVLSGECGYYDAGCFELVIVDEAHGFRNDDSRRFGYLQKICKTGVSSGGLRKKVMLLSATPLNNDPEDLLNQLLLFEDGRCSTIDGVPNLVEFFQGHINTYKKLMREREERRRDVTVEADRIYEDIRERVIDKVTIRRTRHNILSNAEYLSDLKSQGIELPVVAAPCILYYSMSESTASLFRETLSVLGDESGAGCLHYARYRAIEFLNEDALRRGAGGGRSSGQAVQTSHTLAGLYRVLMVKRLESSFHAFRCSLRGLLQITCDMIGMFSRDRVLIVPDLNVGDLLASGLEYDAIVEKALERGHSKEGVEFRSCDFDGCFLSMLEEDRVLLEDLVRRWEGVSEDPKFDAFRDALETRLFEGDINDGGKLVLFSESVDTLRYLEGRLKGELGRDDVLMVSASNRDVLRDVIRENFDANCLDQKDCYNILITSDVLSEGVNLHRANVLVNYDTPWNSTRLMQRIGRVNRIGSRSARIHNFLFYPSEEGDREIGLYSSALIKLQAFHTAFGEDAQIFSSEEIVKQFDLFDTGVADETDKRLALLEEVRALYVGKRKEYDRIKGIPAKSRVVRSGSGVNPKGRSLVFLRSEVKTEFYVSDAPGAEPRAIDFVTAAEMLRAKPRERAVSADMDRSGHYREINRALDAFKSTYSKAVDTDSLGSMQGLDRKSKEAINLLRRLCRLCEDDKCFVEEAEKLIDLLVKGTYNQLAKDLGGLRGPVTVEEKVAYVRDVARKYGASGDGEGVKKDVEPSIILSETFV